MECDPIRLPPRRLPAVPMDQPRDPYIDQAEGPYEDSKCRCGARCYFKGTIAYPGNYRWTGREEVIPDIDGRGNPVLRLKTCEFCCEPERDDGTTRAGRLKCSCPCLHASSILITVPPAREGERLQNLKCKSPTRLLRLSC